MKFKNPFSPQMSWAIYDFANTIFSAAVITLFFPLYFTELTAANTYLGIATTITMVFAGLATPIAGRVCDQTHCPKHYLQIMTLLCILCTSFLSFFGHPFLLFLTYILACFFFHLSLVFYNAMLPRIASPLEQGRISGLGVGLGYLGIVITLPIMSFVQQQLGVRWVFLLTSLLFLIFSLPLFLNVNEKKTNIKIAWGISFFLNEWKKIYATFLHICQKPKMLLFFGGNFFILDALNSTIAWFAVYSKNVFELKQSDLIVIMILLNICAFLFGLIAGFLSDRVNAYFVLTTAATALLILLLNLTQEITLFAFKVLSFTLGAYALAGIWTAGRKVLIELAPEDKRGEYFGVYGLVTKVSIIGSFFYGVMSDFSGMQKGLWVLVFPAFCGTVFLLLSAFISKNIKIDYGKN